MSKPQLSRIGAVAPVASPFLTWPFHRRRVYGASGRVIMAGSSWPTELSERGTEDRRRHPARRTRADRADGGRGPEPVVACPARRRRLRSWRGSTERVDPVFPRRDACVETRRGHTLGWSRVVQTKGAAPSCARKEAAKGPGKAKGGFPAAHATKPMILFSAAGAP